MRWLHGKCVLPAYTCAQNCWVQCVTLELQFWSKRGDITNTYSCFLSVFLSCFFIFTFQNQVAHTHQDMRFTVLFFTTLHTLIRTRCGSLFQLTTTLHTHSSGHGVVHLFNLKPRRTHSPGHGVIVHLCVNWAPPLHVALYTVYLCTHTHQNMVWIATHAVNCAPPCMLHCTPYTSAHTLTRTWCE